jgi:transposase
VPYNTLQAWRIALKTNGVVKDKRFGNSTKQKKFSDEALKAYAEENTNATLKDIGDYFNVSEVAIWKRFKSLGYSYKKKKWCIEKEMKQDERNSNKN